MRHVQVRRYRVYDYPNAYYIYKKVVFKKPSECWQVGDEMRSFLHFLGYEQLPLTQSSLSTLTVFRMPTHRIPLETLDAALATALTVLDARPVAP